MKNHSPKKGPESGEFDWVMHQYHFGTKEDVREVEYVVAKVPYRPQKQAEHNDDTLIIKDTRMGKSTIHDVIPVGM